MSTLQEENRDSHASASLPARQHLASWVDEHSDALYRYALTRVSDEHLAEDLLQETFLGALKSFDGFQHKSKLRTWLISILQRKIVDHFRRRMRAEKFVTQQTDELKSTDCGQPASQQKWDSRPESTVENQEFWATLQSCLQKLPENLSLAFQLRDLDGCDPKSICQMLDITGQNLAVRVYRARRALRDCLNLNWFAKG